VWPSPHGATRASSREAVFVIIATRPTLTLPVGRRSITTEGTASRPHDDEPDRRRISMTLTRDRRTELLAAAPLLAGVDPAGLDRIADRTVEVTFTDGHVIARQGEVGTGFFLIAGGGARVVRDGETIATLGPGDFFGELSVLDGMPRVAQVLAQGETTCLALATWDLEAIINEQPSVGLALLRGLAGRLRKLTEAGRH
jgi:CRP/FNR family cyclic AMP-dependent transcriptional regulator